MFKSIAWPIGLRYVRAERRNHFISFISWASTIGIALGVTVLITVLSVMNGFDQQIKAHIFSMVPQITITALDGKMNNWQDWQRKLDRESDITAVVPFVSSQGLISFGRTTQPVIISGIVPKEENKVTELANKMTAGSLYDLKPGKFNIVLGQKLARSLNVRLGDKVRILIPQASVTPVGVIPRYKRFTVSGVFNTGGGFGFERRLVFLHLTDSQKLLQMGNTVSGLRLETPDLYRAPQIGLDLLDKLPAHLQVSDWTVRFGAFFKAVHMEKTMMFLILMLLIAIAAFNLVSSLVMIVTDKQADIAILRTLGTRPRTIMAIFIIQGCLVGGFGTLLGTIGGVSLAANVTPVVQFIERTFNVQFISSQVYLIDYLPSRILASDVIQVALAAFLMSVLATLYPAWRASRVNPAEALRYE